MVLGKEPPLIGIDFEDEMLSNIIVSFNKQFKVVNEQSNNTEP